MPDRTLTGLAFEELASRLGSRTRALAARRWLFAVRPVPSALPDRIPGVSIAAWARSAPRRPCRRGGSRRAARRPTARSGSRSTSPERPWRRCSSPAAVAAPSASRARPAARATAGSARPPRSDSRASSPPGEIVLQYLVARAVAPAEAPARNVVFMGMGEPMDNLDAVLAAVSRLTDEGAPRLSADQRDGLDVGRRARDGALPPRVPRAPRAVAQRDDRRAARAADAAQQGPGPSRRCSTRCARTSSGLGPPLLHRVRALGRA